jgi:hypothetical protein
LTAPRRRFNFHRAGGDQPERVKVFDECAQVARRKLPK